ncbi:MAG: transposase [Candidatus Levybacteria bacterium]|nr:transposase [Candidatus Levybacteria bacterium]
MYKEKWKNYFFTARPIEIPGKWILLRGVGRDILSEKAQEKLEWIIFYHTIAKKNVLYTASYFGISSKTLYKWLRRFEEKNLSSLEEHKRTPVKKRTWMVTFEEEVNIRDLRKKNMEFGKQKLKVLYEREYGKKISTWKIERVVRKHHLYPDPVQHQYQTEKRANSKAKIRIHTIKDQLKQIKEFGFLWHIDAIIIWWYGQRRIIFTAIEEITKISFARVYKTNTSGFAEDFLKRLTYLAEGKINIMHQDNGAEFQGAFERACETLKILQIYSRPYTPKDNPALERFNNTVQSEWLKYSKIGLDDIVEANQDLTKWLIKYNSYRPHEALDYKTPLEYAQENFFQLLPMWSARTLS